MQSTPDLPVPAGFTADDRTILTDSQSLVRFVTWSKHDAARVALAVDGAQYGDGHVDSHISLYDTECKELTAADARALAAALIGAADALELVQSGPDSQV